MKKEKQHKKGESTIGKIIYSFLLFMPLFAIGVTCGYAIFNKNAYQSYSANAENSIQYEQVTELKANHTYFMDLSDNAFSIDTGMIEVTDFNGISSLSNANDFFVSNNNNIKYIRSIPTGTNQAQIFFYNNNFTRLNFWNYGDTYGRTFNLTFVSVNNINAYTFIDTYELTNVQTTYLDNAFYYAVDKVTESPLFSWAENSIIYDTLNATCTQLSITTPFIPLLLAYWLIISVIYFLYDIALMLIWLLHDKIHELRDNLA